MKRAPGDHSSGALKCNSRKKAQKNEEQNTKDTVGQTELLHEFGLNFIFANRNPEGDAKQGYGQKNKETNQKRNNASRGIS